MKDFAEKDALIQKIQKFHPGECLSRWKKKGWAWYVGGMRDDGDWNFEKMIRAEVKELAQCLNALELQRKRRAAAAKKPAIPLEEWLQKTHEEVVLEALLGHKKQQNLTFFPKPAVRKRTGEQK